MDLGILASYIGRGKAGPVFIRKSRRPTPALPYYSKAEGDGRTLPFPYRLYPLYCYNGTGPPLIAGSYHSEPYNSMGALRDKRSTHLSLKALRLSNCRGHPIKKGCSRFSRSTNGTKAAKEPLVAYWPIISIGSREGAYWYGG